MKLRTLLIIVALLVVVYAVASFTFDNMTPLAQSLYFQVIAAASFRSIRIDGVNFEVYKEDPVTS